jgi:hypothetical protein
MQPASFEVHQAPVLPTVLTGQRFATGDIAYPSLDRIPGRVQVIKLEGRLVDRFAAQGFYLRCRHARLDPSCELAVLLINVWQSDWSLVEFVDPLAALSSTKPTIAYIECALGSSLALSYFCCKTLCHPCAEIGHLQSFVAAEGSPIETINEGILDAGTIEGLIKLRPAVEERVWWDLLGGSVSGERAEMLGIVDSCANPGVFGIKEDKP